jgi:tetratricopeptide (TPR) repeat protein
VSRSHARVAEVVLGAALAGVAFGAAGGTELSRTTIVELLMVLVGGVVVAAAVVLGHRGRVYGGTGLALFAALALLTALSITWAVVPGLAYIETGRTLAYLAVFAAAVAGARMAPRAAPVAINGIVLAAMAVVAYALASRVWPDALAEDELSNRIGQPFQYWNAVGTTAALAVPGLLWLGTRRTAGLASRVLAYPALGAAIVAILLTQSRGALAAAVLGAIAWLAIVPLRMRTLPVIALPAIGGGAVAAWALSKDAFAVSLQPLAVKESVAGDFGLLLVLMAVGLALAGLAVNAGVTRGVPSPRLRRRLGVVALVGACALPLVAFTSVAFSDRGIGGTLDDRFNELTSDTETAPTRQGAARLTEASSTRGKYWREAGNVFEDRPAVGAGAGNFQAARLRHRSDVSRTRHAHGFVPQTLADLGVAGVALTSALLLAWLVAVARATGLHPRRLPFRRSAHGAGPRRDWDGDRIALVALSLVAVVFGLQSLVDWTWFVPGPTTMALVAGGFVAGRAPLGVRVGQATHPGLPEDPGAAWPPREPSPARLLAASAVLLAALLTAWAIWQPEAADRATTDAIRLAEAGELDAAIARTEDAAAMNPLSSEPLLVQAGFETTVGRESAAQESLEQAVLKFPGEAQTWYQLALFQLGTLDQPRQAAATVGGAIFLDPLSVSARALYLAAKARAREQAAGRPTG